VTAHKPPAPWKLQSPALTTRCKACGAPVRVRMTFTGRWDIWSLSGRGWRNKRGQHEDANPTVTGESNPSL
jgi:hypothetical protein